MLEKQVMPQQGTRHAEAIQEEIDRRKMVIRSKKHLSLIWSNPVQSGQGSLQTEKVEEKVGKNEQK